jgi:hypothetical protein
MASYQEEIAAWRMQRQQQEIVDRAQQIQQEYAIAERERDTAIANNDMEEATYRDNECMDLQKEYNRIVPPQPTMHPRDAEYLRKRHAFRARHGLAGDYAIRLAHEQAIKNGYSPATPAYYQHVDDNLELYAKHVKPPDSRNPNIRFDMFDKTPGLRFDPEESALTANEVVNMVRNSKYAGGRDENGKPSAKFGKAFDANGYNTQVQRVQAAQKFSWQERK